MTIRLEVRSIYSTDLPSLGDLPRDPMDCVVNVHMGIGVFHKAGVDQFTVQVCTPKWIARQVLSNGVLLGHGFIIVPIFDWTIVESALNTLVEQISVESWEGAIERLRRHAAWEFD